MSTDKRAVGRLDVAAPPRLPDDAVETYERLLSALAVPAGAAAPGRKMEWRARLPRVEDIEDPVHDGDTCWMETDQGDWYRKIRDCRLLDTWAPELKQPGGAESEVYATAWIARFNVGKWPFWVDTFQTGSGRDVLTFNRYVTQVWNADRTRSLNADMAAFVLANGYGGGTGA